MGSASGGQSRSSDDEADAGSADAGRLANGVDGGATEEDGGSDHGGDSGSLDLRNASDTGLKPGDAQNGPKAAGGESIEDRLQRLLEVQEYERMTLSEEFQAQIEERVADAQEVADAAVAAARVEVVRMEGEVDAIKAENARLRWEHDLVFEELDALQVERLGMGVGMGVGVGAGVTGIGVSMGGMGRPLLACLASQFLPPFL